MCKIYKRILFIAPADSGLDVVPEIDALYEYNYIVQSVQGEVTRARLFEVARRQRFGVVHFACHSDADGVLLSNGERFDAPSLIQFVKAVGANLVFLNGCATAEIGQMLVDEDVPAAICTLRRVDDQIAKETAQVFYKALAQRGDLRQAYHDSRPAIKGGYSLFTNGLLEVIQYAPILTRLDSLEELLAKSRNEYAVIFASNNAEHAEFRKTVAMFGDQARQRKWILRICIATLVTSLCLQLVITFIGRSP